MIYAAITLYCLIGLTWVIMRNSEDLLGQYVLIDIMFMPLYILCYLLDIK